MLDFMKIKVDRKSKKNTEIVAPNFRIVRSKDLMIRGGDFYAVWDATNNVWSTDEQTAVELIDAETAAYLEEHSGEFDNPVPMYLSNADSGMIDKWHKYCQRQLRDNFVELDSKLIFSDTQTTKASYSSKRLSYPLLECPTPCYESLMSVLYSPEERHKIEWAIGAVASGDSKKIQKFVVLYGSAGTGKSTVLNIISELFQGYVAAFDSAALGRASASFALEPFHANPLVGIEHDGDLSKIETNTRLNSLVSHEEMTVNEKFKNTYSTQFNAFLFIGTNKPVKITDAKSGLLRRLIDVRPTGDKVAPTTYHKAVDGIKFELGGIAKKCLNVYLENPRAYDDYIPINMMSGTNDFYNFVLDCSDVFEGSDEFSIRQLYSLYKEYCEDARVAYPYSRRVFKEELKNYFEEYEERGMMGDGTRARSVYRGFRMPQDKKKAKKSTISLSNDWLTFNNSGEVFSEAFGDCPAQYATDDGTPRRKWENVRSRLCDLDQTRLHYVVVPYYLIVIDFDIKNADGEKDRDANLKAASKWPKTYAEYSKSGGGVHLHYWYDGNPDLLEPEYAPGIEVKVYSGNSSLRRMVTKSNTVPIAHISSGLPLKEKRRKMNVNDNTIKSERGLRALIVMALEREIGDGHTKPSIDFIKHVLYSAKDQGLSYDVSDLYDNIVSFAAMSSNQSDYCLDVVEEMELTSDDRKKEEAEEPIFESQNPLDDSNLVFYDIECYKNYFLIVGKPRNSDDWIVLEDPTPNQVLEFTKLKLVGFNCRQYDNHMLHARIMGYSNEALYNLSQELINGVGTQGKFMEAYKYSYTDVLDFCSNKQSLKKWEIELGIHHKEMDIPWDRPVPDNRKADVVRYCKNDVLATEAVFDANQNDYAVRKMLVSLATELHGVAATVNDTTNNLACKIIFGNDKAPQTYFNYRNLGEKTNASMWTCDELLEWYRKDSKNKHLVFPQSAKGMPYFSGYVFDKTKPKKKRSTYRGVNVGEGGLVFARPGYYRHIKTQDVSSMHPSSIIAENLFGKYTKNFKALKDVRLYIKHENYDECKKLFGGLLAPYLTDKKAAKQLSKALKIVINSVYGQTSASYKNRCRDPRNVDNIVAKRGALFMCDLKYAIESIFPNDVVVHIKTDSIKVANTSPEIIEFIRNFGKAYGYDFETEDEFDKLCLVNDAVYIARTEAGIWEATGKQFAEPYVFKSLFSKEPIVPDDYNISQSTRSVFYLDKNEGLQDVSAVEKELKDNSYILNRIDDPGLIVDRAKFTKRLATYCKKYECPDTPEALRNRNKQLVERSLKGHNYIFVGKVGRFTPVVSGQGGGYLYRYDNGKYSSATGSKGYRWVESEQIGNRSIDDLVDFSYFEKLADEAKAAIDSYVSFEEFVA